MPKINAPTGRRAKVAVRASAIVLSARYPTADQIRLICQAALGLGIRHLDMYGYRIGDYVIKPGTTAQWVPPDPAPYKLTNQFPQKFLWDRPGIHRQLAGYLNGLNPK
jgi:hypothetical protein